MDNKKFAVITIYSLCLLILNSSKVAAEDNYVFGNPVDYQSEYLFPKTNEQEDTDNSSEVYYLPEQQSENSAPTQPTDKNLNTQTRKMYQNDTTPNYYNIGNRQPKYDTPQQNYSNFEPASYREFPNIIKIPTGTAVTIYNTQEINADHLDKGQTIEFSVDNPVIINGVTVIQAGTRVSAQVMHKKNNFIFGIPGEIEVGNFKLNNLGNNPIEMIGSITEKGESRYWAHIGWIIVWPLLLVKGGDGIIPAGHRYTIHTIGDTYFKLNDYPARYNQYSY